MAKDKRVPIFGTCVKCLRQNISIRRRGQCRRCYEVAPKHYSTPRAHSPECAQDITRVPGYEDRIRNLIAHADQRLALYPGPRKRGAE
jgi:hypothetical protein